MRSGGRMMWLWWWLGVFVAGCGQAAFSGSTPQPAPLLTLTLPGTSTPTPTLRLLRTPAVRITNLAPLTRAVPTPVPLAAKPPTCYETPVGSLRCLGLVRNSLSITLERVVVRVYLVNNEGTALAEKETPIALRLLAPGEASPYGVLFDAVPEGNAGPLAVVVSAIEYRGPSAMLEIRDVRNEMRETGFHVSGMIANPTTTTVQNMALVVTFFDVNQRVTGFRALRWPTGQQLAPAAVMPFGLDAVPQGLGTVRAEVSGEAQPG